MSKEIWKELPNTEGRYLISSYGRIKSLPFIKKGNKSEYLTKEKIIKTGADKDGYRLFVYSINSVRTTTKVHRLVAELFIPNPQNKPQVNHKDSIRDNNHYTNLEWVTEKENTQHGVDYGAIKPTNGETNGMSILKELDVIAIRKAHAKGGLTYKDIAKDYNVNDHTIGKIVRRENWKHL